MNDTAFYKKFGCPGFYGDGYRNQKYVCFSCRIARKPELKLIFAGHKKREHFQPKCGECGNPMGIVNSGYRFPKKHKLKAWKVIYNFFKNK